MVSEISEITGKSNAFLDRSGAMAYNDDADFIRGELDRQLERLLGVYFSGHVVRKGKAYLTPKNDRNLGSFTVNLSGPRRGQWYRHSQKVGGGTVELLSYHLTNGLTAYAQAFAEARAFLGISGQVDQQASERHKKENAERRKAAEASEQKERARKSATAAQVWSQCKPIAGTPAEKYLLQRGLPVPPAGWPDCLGFHNRLWHELEELNAPALVARLDDVLGEMKAVWRIYLDGESGRKADVENPKLGLGPSIGCAVRLGGLAPRIGSAEGIETAIAAWALNGFRFPVWSMLSTSGMAGFEIPIEVEHIDIFPDGDARARRKDGIYVPEPVAPGLRAARALWARAKEVGVGATIQPEPPQGVDYLDLFVMTKKEEE